MVQATIKTKSPIQAAKLALKNTLNFENCAFFTKYDYAENDKALGSSLNLYWQDNFILNTIVPYLKSHSDIKEFTDSDKDAYYEKPMTLSYYTYGTIDYWWVILAVNGYFNPQEFTGFEKLYVSLNPVVPSANAKLFKNENPIRASNRLFLLIM